MDCCSLEGMIAMSTMLKEISALTGLPEEKLLRNSFAAYLRERKRLLMAERFEILSRYQTSSSEEIKKKIERGEIPDHPAWEDYIELLNIDDELRNTENAIRSLTGSELYQ
jgi:hypothetical protein